MNKGQLFETMSLTERDEVILCGQAIAEQHEVIMIKKPQRMLVMLKVRESARNTLFYAAEALASECMVRIGDVKGYAACLGDDFQKVYAMAVIDAALNAALPESEMIKSALAGWSSKITEARAADARLLLSTKVDFNIMEE